MRRDPDQVAAAAAGHVPGPQRVERAVDERDRAAVDDGRHVAGPGQLVEVTEQPEAGHVGSAGDPGRQRVAACAGVERRHDLDRGFEHLPGRLVPRVQHAAADRLGQRQRQAGCACVDPQQVCRVGEPGDSHAVLRLWVVDAVTARHMAAGPGRHVQAAAQYLGGQVGGQHVPRPAQQVDRHEGLATDGIDVGQRVGGGDPAEGIGVVDDRGEEVRRRHDGPVRADPDHGGVVAMLDTDEQVGRPLRRDQPGDGLLKFAGRDLARAPAAARVLGEPDCGLGGHNRTVVKAGSCGPAPRMVACVLVDTLTGARADAMNSRR